MIACESEELAPYLEKFSPEQKAMLQDPRAYTGIAAEKTRNLCDEYEKRLGALMDKPT